MDAQVTTRYLFKWGLALGALFFAGIVLLMFETGMGA